MICDPIAASQPLSSSVLIWFLMGFGTGFCEAGEKGLQRHGSGCLRKRVRLLCSALYEDS
eukprot:scaffold8136_cov127-Cylindrotheca_fusiformis.AAC.7